MEDRKSPIMIWVAIGGIIAFLGLIVVSVVSYTKVTVSTVSAARADTNQSPQQFFQYAVGNNDYRLSYLEASNVRHHYDTVAIFNQFPQKPPAFELRDTKPLPTAEGPIYSLTRTLGSGIIQSTTYQGCWVFRSGRSLGDGPWSPTTGYALRFDEIYDGTVCAENRDIVVTLDAFAISGSDIAARSKQTGSCRSPTPEYLARFHITDATEKSIFNPTKVECVYDPEHHKVQFSP